MVNNNRRRPRLRFKRLDSCRLGGVRFIVLILFLSFKIYTLIFPQPSNQRRTRCDFTPVNISIIAGSICIPKICTSASSIKQEISCCTRIFPRNHWLYCRLSKPNCPISPLRLNACSPGTGSPISAAAGTFLLYWVTLYIWEPSTVPKPRMIKLTPIKWLFCCAAVWSPWPMSIHPKCVPPAIC